MVDDRIIQLGRLFAGVLEEGLRVYGAAPAATPPAVPVSGPAASRHAEEATDEPVVIIGAALGLPGVERVFDDENIGRILAGQQLIDGGARRCAPAHGGYAHHPPRQE